MSSQGLVPVDSIGAPKSMPQVSKLSLLTADEVQSRVPDPDTLKFDYYVDNRDSSVIVPVAVKTAEETEETYQQRKRNRHKQVKDAGYAAGRGVPVQQIKDARGNVGRSARRSSGEFNPSPGIRRISSAAVLRQAEKIAKAQAALKKERKARATLKLTLDTVQKQLEEEKKAVDKQLDEIAATRKESATARSKVQPRPLYAARGGHLVRRIPLRSDRHSRLITQLIWHREQRSRDSTLSRRRTRRRGRMRARATR